MTSDAATDKRKPAHKIRSGSITITIWKNEGDKSAWYSVRPSRRYKDGDEWKEADTYGPEDLMTLAKLLDLAHTWIINQQAQRQAA
jgi:hypothetical protein